MAACTASLGRTRAGAWYLALLAASIILVTGCASRAPLPRPPAESAQPAKPDGPFASIEAGIRDRHGDDVSGFRLLRSNLDALAWRLAAIDWRADGHVFMTGDAVEVFQGTIEV